MSVGIEWLVDDSMICFCVWMNEWVDECRDAYDKYDKYLCMNEWMSGWV